MKLRHLGVVLIFLGGSALFGHLAHTPEVAPDFPFSAFHYSVTYVVSGSARANGTQCLDMLLFPDGNFDGTLAIIQTKTAREEVQSRVEPVHGVLSHPQMNSLMAALVSHAEWWRNWRPDTATFKAELRYTETGQHPLKKRLNVVQPVDMSPMLEYIRSDQTFSWSRGPDQSSLGHAEFWVLGVCSDNGGPAPLMWPEIPR